MVDRWLVAWNEKKRQNLKEELLEQFREGASVNELADKFLGKKQGQL